MAKMWLARERWIWRDSGYVLSKSKPDKDQCTLQPEWITWDTHSSEEIVLKMDSEYYHRHFPNAPRLKPSEGPIEVEVDIRLPEKLSG